MDGNLSNAFRLFEGRAGLGASNSARFEGFGSNSLPESLNFTGGQQAVQEFGGCLVGASFNLCSLNSQVGMVVKDVN